MRERKRKWYGYLEWFVDLRFWGVGFAGGFGKLDGLNASIVIGPISVMWSTK